jgi:hypothetical protein
MSPFSPVNGQDVTPVSELFVPNDIFDAWKAHLECIGPPPCPVDLPAGDALEQRLRHLEIPEEDIPDVIRLAPSPEQDPELWWYLERTVHSLGLHMGKAEGPPRFGTLRDINDPRYRYFFVHMFAAAMPQVQQYFRERNIPNEIAQATLADLGRNVRVHRKREGVGGLGVAWWLMLHFRGMIYQLGRLQFERSLLGERGAEGAAKLGIAARPDDHVLSIHIPDFCGPMTPEACDASIAEAHTFFSTHFPEESVRAGVCSSWLLDPQLKEYLHPASNIIRFQDRFQMLEGGYNVNNSIVQFVFGPNLERLDTLPQRSTLERAVVAHLKAGKDWEGRLGWFPW